jgi:hypothetical protein
LSEDNNKELPEDLIRRLSDDENKELSEDEIR